jgi:hypothetical protein
MMTLTIFPKEAGDHLGIFLKKMYLNILEDKDAARVHTITEKVAAGQTLAFREASYTIKFDSGRVLYSSGINQFASDLSVAVRSGETCSYTDNEWVSLVPLIPLVSLGKSKKPLVTSSIYVELRKACVP